MVLLCGGGIAVVVPGDFIVRAEKLDVPTITAATLSNVADRAGG